MIRKMLVVAAAIAIPVSVVAVSGGVATAARANTAASDTAACKTITGTVTFSPKLTSKGYTSGHITTKITATLGGCTVKGSTAIKITKGAVTGSIVGATGTKAKPTGTCTGLLGNSVDTGTLTTKWTATPTTPNSVLNIKSVTGGAAGGHGTFTIPGTTKGTASGSFVGTNHGASDKSIAETTLTTSALASACTKSGLSSIKIQTEPGKTAVTLG